MGIGEGELEEADAGPISGLLSRAGVVRAPTSAGEIPYGNRYHPLPSLLICPETRVILDTGYCNSTTRQHIPSYSSKRWMRQRLVQAHHSLRRLLGRHRCFPRVMGVLRVAGRSRAGRDRCGFLSACNIIHICLYNAYLCSPRLDKQLGQT